MPRLAAFLPLLGALLLPPLLADPASDPIRAFDRWLDHYVAEPPPSRPPLADGLALAQARLAALAELLPQSPASAWRAALPPGLRSALPPELAAHLETRVEARGALLPVGDSDWAFEHGPVRYAARFVRPPAALARRERIDRFPVIGIALGDTLLIAPQAWRRLEPGEPGHDERLAQISLAGERHDFADETDLAAFLADQDRP